MARFQVYYDNGASDCGTFKERFGTEVEAKQFANEWANERNLEDLGLTPEQVEERGGEGCYTAEVIQEEEEGGEFPASCEACGNLANLCICEPPQETK